MLNKLADIKTHNHVLTLMIIHNCNSKISFTNDKYCSAVICPLLFTYVQCHSVCT